MLERMSAGRLVAPLAALALVAACHDSVAPVTVVDPPSQFISMKRAWLPGERDSTIARIKRNHEFVAPYVGDISDDADKIYADLDSVVVVVSNPLFDVRAAGPSGLTMAPRFNASWNLTGIDVRIVNIEVTPNDTLHWLGMFWSNPAEVDWKGFSLVATNTNPATTTVAATQVSTTAFDGATGHAGAGAGEVRASTSTTWLANGPGTAPNNNVQITAAAWGASGTVTTGPFLGGTAANGTMQGRLRTVDMTRVAGATAPLTFQVDFDFRGAAIAGIRYICVFRNPCTTNVPNVRSGELPVPGPTFDAWAARQGRP